MVPINVDRNVGPAVFKDRPELAVTSIFYTIQGEGPFAGQPAVFLRLAGCNLGAKRECPFCDTKFDMASAKWMTVQDIINVVNVEWPWGNDRPLLLVVTGGEPLLQWDNLRQLLVSMEATQSQPVTCQVETNGMFLQDRIISQAKASRAFYFVVSPKIVRPDGKYTRLSNAQKSLIKARLMSVKYVVCEPVVPVTGCTGYEGIPLECLKDVDPRHVYISGMTDYTDSEDAAGKPGVPASVWRLGPVARRRTSLNYAYAAQLALRHGFNLSVQTHLFAGVE